MRDEFQELEIRIKELEQKIIFVEQVLDFWKEHLLARIKELEKNN